MIIDAHLHVDDIPALGWKLAAGDSGLGQQDAELALESSPNLFIQTSGVYREDFLEGVVSRFGAERLLYASAFPRFDPRLELLRIRWAPNLRDQAQAPILAGNAWRLLLS